MFSVKKEKKQILKKIKTGIYVHQSIKMLTYKMVHGCLRKIWFMFLTIIKYLKNKIAVY